MADHIPVQGRGGKPTFAHAGVDTSAPFTGGFLTFVASGSGAWASTEAADTMDFDGSSGIAGPWASQEQADVFEGDGYLPIAGPWASTEATDTSDIWGFVPPQATWASTENADGLHFGTDYHRRLKVLTDTITPAGSSFRFTTTKPNLILIYVYTNGSAGFDNPPDWLDTISVENHPEIKFTPQVSTVVGPNEDGSWMSLQIAWAYAPLPIDDEVVTRSDYAMAGGLGGTSSVETIFAIQGMQGSFGDPFIDPNPLCRGSGMGNLFSNTIPNTPITSFSPLVTGPLGGSLTTSSVTFSTANMATLSGGNLVVNSDANNSPAHSNYALMSAADSVREPVYFEVTFNAIYGSDYAAGLLWQSADPVDLCTDGTGGLIVRGDGSIWSGGSQLGTITAPDPGDVIGIAVNPATAMAFVRNITKGDSFNGAPQYADYGSKASDGYFISGGFGVVSTSDSGVQRGAKAGYNASGYLTPAAFPGGTNVLSQQTYNFGATSFVGAPPTGFRAGWAHLIDNGTPTRVHYPSIVVGATATVNSTAPSTPSGFTSLNQRSVTGSQVTLDLNTYVKVCDENVLETDNEFLTANSPDHWLMLFDTLVVGDPDPGSWDSSEGADVFVGAGYLIPGIHGVMALTEAKDVMAFSGNIPSLGEWISTEAVDIMSMYIKIPIQGTFNVTEATDIWVAEGIGLGVDGEWHSTESLDIFAATGTVPISGPFDTSEASDRFLALGAGVTRVRRRRSFFVT